MRWAVMMTTTNDFEQERMRCVSAGAAVKRKFDLVHFFAVTSAALGLAAIVPGAGASALGDLAAQMQPGEWRELKTNNFTGILLPNFAGDGSSPFIEFTDRAVRNPLTKKVIILGCSRGAPGGNGKAYSCGGQADEDSGFVEYDENSNSWTRRTDGPVSGGPHAYNHATLNPANGDYFYRESNQLSNFKLWKWSGGQWTTLTTPPNTFSGFGALEFFPERNALVFVDGGDGFPAKVLTLPSGSSSWSSTPVNAPIGKFSNFSQYSPKRKVLFFGGGTDGDRVLVKMDAQGTITRCADAPLSIGVFGSNGRQSIDPVTGNLLAFDSGTPNTGHVFEYDPGTNQWTKHGTHPLGTSSGQVISVMTPVQEQGVILVVNFNYGNDKVYLYRHSAGKGDPVPTTKTPQPPSNVSAQ